MTEATKTEKPKLRIPEQGPWAQAWKAAAVLGVLGLGVSAVGYTANPERFAFSYLFAFLVVMTVALGAMFFVLVQHLTSAHWSVTVRRTSEFFMVGIVVLPLLFLPLIPSMGQLYPWASHGGDEHGTAHAQTVEHPPRAEALGEHPPGSEHHAEEPVFIDDRGAWHVRTHHDPEHATHSAIVAKKTAFLNVPFFAGRAIIYFLLWLGIAHLFFTWSTRQDETGDPKLTVKMQRWAPAGIIIFALATTFAGVDWVMSMQPAWYSTMFGVHIFASSAVTVFGVIILTTLALRRAGLLGNIVNVEHYHDLGKLQFGFLVFWGYIAFSEFMLIWYSAIPEETTYFHMRWDIMDWRWVSIGLVALHFIVPFWLIMSRNTKRNLPMLGFTAAWILLMHVLEAYWLVMPYFGGPELEFSMVWLDLACLLGVLGIYLAVVFRRMMRYSLIPIRDPRLERSLHFVNA